MAEAGIEVAVKGASKSTGELKKVAGGYQAIGKAASSASSDVEKLERAENKRERRAKRYINDRADLLGNFGGSAVKNIGSNFAQMGPVGAAIAGIGMLANAAIAADDRAVESASRVNNEMQTFATSVRASTVALEANAAATVRAQSANDRREFGKEDQKTFTKVDVMRKEVDDRAKTRLAENALEGQRKEVFASRNPNMALALPQIEVMRQKLEDQSVRADTQGGVAAFRDNAFTLFGGGGSEENKRRVMLNEFAEASGRILSAATALDRAANSRSASLPSP